MIVYPKMLQLLCFRYFTVDDLKDTKDNLLKISRDKKLTAEIENFFSDVLVERDWEKGMSSINPGVELTTNTENLIRILSPMVSFDRIKDIKVHWLRVGSNPFGFQRILIFESILSEENLLKEFSPKVFEDRFLAGLREFDRIDNIFVSKGFKDLKPNIWLAINYDNLQNQGLWEKPSEVNIKNKKATLERYWEVEGWYVIYSNEPVVTDLELNDLAFVLITPFRRDEFRNEAKKIDNKITDWHSSVRELILGTGKITDLNAREKLIDDITRQMDQYFVHEQSLNELSERALTLYGRVQRAKKAPEGQIHREMATDLESDIQETLEFIETIRSRLKDAFDGLQKIFSTSSTTVQLEFLRRTSEAVDGLQKAEKSMRYLTVVLVVLTAILTVVTIGLFMH